MWWRPSSRPIAPKPEKPLVEERLDDVHRIIQPAQDAEKPFGEWNNCQVVCPGGSTTAMINGDVINHIENGPSGTGMIWRTGFEQEPTTAMCVSCPYIVMPILPPQPSSQRMSLLPQDVGSVDGSRANENRLESSSAMRPLGCPGPARPRRLTGHLGGVKCVSFTWDGKYVLSGGDDRMRVWDLETERKLDGWKVTVRAFGAWPSGESRRLVSGGRRASSKLWDFDTGREIRSIKAHTSWVDHVAISPGGFLILSGCGTRRTRRPGCGRTTGKMLVKIPPGGPVVSRRMARVRF